MFNSIRGVPDATARPMHGDVLTVVESSMQHQLNLLLGVSGRPIHLDSLAAAISVARQIPIRAVLLGPAAIAPEAAPLVAKLADASLGGLLIAVVGGWTPSLAESLLAFGGVGVRDAVDLSRREDLSRLRTLLTRGEWDLSTRIMTTLLPRFESATAEMRYFMSQLIRSAPFTSSMRAFAAELRVRDTSLSSRFFRARLPSPKKYLAAARLVYAAAVLETPRVSVAQAALRLHYSSPQSFCRHVREQLGISATGFREKYPFEVMVDHFANHLVVCHEDTLRWFTPLNG